MIQVGQVLDKYELLERVGQGGMAIVYRGIDRTLKRTVAIKVLHKHLSDYQEARDRFEREAQAVAKLRHENILEIFDYSAAKDAEAAGSSYIVTEFIDGQTLKQFITERPITYPEVGAMVVLQVCRALSHAHGAGILHRDIKPENIMIRSDGVVKLMDFGISHMVDLTRLTVTGQLLGSPAYMAPEHVEGRPLDYRTDVFAVGIVLYQLTVGRLPFEGKNPHEVLKRIAECKFVDPRQANPRLGNRLGRIILRAMAAAPDGRYPAIGEMVMAIEGYLEESGLPSDKVAGELGRYFKAPVAYEQALKDRLVDHLTRRGAKLLDTDRSAALDIFDRVLTIDKDNAKVIAILDGINRRRRLRSVVIALGAAAVLGVGAWSIHKRMQPEPIEPPVVDFRPGPYFTGPVTHVEQEPAPVFVDAGPEPDAPTVAVQQDARTAQIDAAVLASYDVPVVVTPAQGSRYRIGTGEWKPVPSEHFAVAITGDAVLHVENPLCQPMDLELKPGQGEAVFDMKFMGATIVAQCERDVTVEIEGRPVKRGEAYTVTFGDTTLTKKAVTVEFVGGKKDVQKVTVQPNETKQVTCAAP